MQVNLLGPIEIDGRPGEAMLGAAKERWLLAALALSPRSVVSVDALMGALWGDDPPISARKTLQTYVSHLRSALGPGAVVTSPDGYALDISGDDVDVVRFRLLVRAGESALRGDDIAAARRALGDAVALWRGQPFPGVAAHTALASEAVRLRQEYLGALEAQLSAELAAGRHGELIGELEALVREHPFRERLWGHLIVAMYRAGRQADALDAYQRARSVLRDELGLEPGGELQRLERAVLDQDPALDPSPPRLPSPAPRAAGPVARSAVRYAVCRDGVHVAYRVVGDGPIDVIAIPGYVSHLDMWWDAPTDQLLRRLTSFSRLILFDKRGMGLSDRPAHIDINQWVDDAVAVLDAVGSERAVIFGISAGGPTAMLFTAQHPARARALILYGGYARFVRGDDYEFGFERSAVSSFIGHALANWGTGVGISVLAPSRAKDADAKQYWARLQTISASPAAAATFLRALSEIDIRDVLPSIRVPTLILHPQRDMSVPIEAARLMHGLIAGSALVELDSDVHLIWLSDVIDEIADEIETFVGAAADVSDTGDTIVVTVLAIDPPMAGEDMAAMDAVVRRHGGHPLGIGNRAAFDSPASAIRCGLALVSHTGPHGGRLAIGIHTGQCEVTEDGPGGIAVDLAGQLAVGAQPGQLLVSQTVRDLIIGSPVTLEPRGKRLFAGIQGEWELFEIGGPALAPAPERSVAG